MDLRHYVPCHYTLYTGFAALPAEQSERRGASPQPVQIDGCIILKEDVRELPLHIESLHQQEEPLPRSYFSTYCVFLLSLLDHASKLRSLEDPDLEFFALQPQLTCFGELERFRDDVCGPISADYVELEPVIQLE